MNRPYTDRYIMEQKKTARDLYRENCPHRVWKLNTFPGGKWSRICLDERCGKMFASDSANEDVDADEILI